MSVSYVTSNKIRHTGNGSSTNFSFPFKVLNQSHLKVYYVTIATNAYVLKTLGVDYTVVISNPAEGGSITTSVAPSASIAVLILNDPDESNSIDISNEILNASAIQTALDRFSMGLMRLHEKIKRAPKTTLGSTTGELVFPEPLAKKAIKWNDAGTALENSESDIDEVLVDAVAAQEAAEAAQAAAEAASTNAQNAESGAESAESNAEASAELAEKWAIETANTVDGSEFSAKEYAQGTQGATGGSAKDWALKVGAAVTGSLYSAKEWAVGVFTRGTVGGGSAKDWATYVGGTVDDAEFSAKQYALDAAQSAEDAEAFADPPITNKGDLLTRTSSALARLPVGSDGQMLTPDASEATGLKWRATPTFNEVSPMTTAGDMIIGGVSGAGTRLALGDEGSVLTSNGTTIAYNPIATKNYVDNAQFRFWQRQDPGTFTNRTDDQYSADRWYVLTSGGATNVGGIRVEDSPSSSPSRYCGHWRQGDATARQFGVCQIQPANDCIELRGKQVTLSFWAKTESTEITAIRAGIVEWTGTADVVTSDIVSSWSGTPTLITNAAFRNTPSDLTISSTWTRFTITMTLGTTFNNLAFFVWTPNTEAQNDSLFLTQVQVTIGAVPKPWNVLGLSYERDLSRCRMFYQKSYNVDVAPASITGVGQLARRADGTTDRGFAHFYPTMFATPTVNSYSPGSGASGNWRDVTGTTDKVYTPNNPGQGGSAFVGTSTVDGNLYEGHWVAESEM